MSTEEMIVINSPNKNRKVKLFKILMAMNTQKFKCKNKRLLNKNNWTNINKKSINKLTTKLLILQK